MSKHTPGPWEVRVDRGPVADRPGLNFYEVMKPDPRDQGPNDPNRHIIADLGCSSPEAELEANASLIAAAPELFAALSKLLESDNIDPRTWPALCGASILYADGMAEARAAIAKARARCEECDARRADGEWCKDGPTSDPDGRGRNGRRPSPPESHHPKETKR